MNATLEAVNGDVAEQTEDSMRTFSLFVTHTAAAAVGVFATAVTVYVIHGDPISKALKQVFGYGAPESSLPGQLFLSALCLTVGVVGALVTRQKTTV